MAAASDRIEAAIQSGGRYDALEWLGRLDAFATQTGIASEQARVAQCRALLAEGETANSLLEEALTLQARSRRPFERARTRSASTCATCSQNSASARVPSRLAFPWTDTWRSFASTRQFAGDTGRLVP
jgi:hypothetical protein